MMMMMILSLGCMRHTARAARSVRCEQCRAHTLKVGKGDGVAIRGFFAGAGEEGALVVVGEEEASCRVRSL